MTETTAKSGGPGTSTAPVDEEPKKDGAAPAGREAAGRAAVRGAGRRITGNHDLVQCGGRNLVAGT